MSARVEQDSHHQTPYDRHREEWQQACINNTTNLTLVEWINAHTTIGEWAAGNPERERQLEIAQQAAGDLLIELHNRRLREWEDHQMEPWRQRRVELQTAAASGDTTINFHMATGATTQGEEHFYMRGAPTAYPGETITFQIPTPQWTATNTTTNTYPALQEEYYTAAGIFHDTIAVPIQPTYTGNFYGSAVGGVWYLQNGTWSGEYTVTIPYTALNDVTNTPPNTVYSNPNRIAHPDDPKYAPVPDTPERNFVALVKRHEIENAYIRSKELVKEWLNPEEYYSLMKFHRFIVPSKLFPNIDYIVDEDDGVYIDAWNGDVSKVEARFCIHVTDRRYQKYDRLLARVLILKADEAEFLRRANQHPGEFMNRDGVPRTLREIIPRAV